MAKGSLKLLPIAVFLLLCSCLSVYAIGTKLIGQETSPASTVVYPGVWVVQTFKLNSSAYVNTVELYLMKNGTIDSLFIGIYEWNTTTVNLGKKLHSQNYTTLPTSYAITQFDFSKSVQLMKNKQYALLIIPNGIHDQNNFNFVGLKMNTSNPYPDGQRYASSNNGQTWNSYDTQDLYFVLYGSWITDPVDVIVQFLPIIVLLMCLGMALAYLNKLSKG
ncbi:MAG: hypothetical protein QW228_08005 [Candidatus Aenigmatarchaeota archaeon]